MLKGKPKEALLIQKLYDPDSLLRLLGCLFAGVHRLVFQSELPQLLHHFDSRSHP